MARTILTALRRLAEDQGRDPDAVLALAEVYDLATDASPSAALADTWVLRFERPRTGRAGRWEVTGRTLEAQRRSPPRTGGGC